MIEPPCLPVLQSQVTLAFDGGESEFAGERVQSRVLELLHAGDLILPEAFHRPGPERYARRLLHRDPQRDLVIVAMAWGPNQGTLLHDHGGRWCFECVLAGEMVADVYEVVERSESGDLLRFRWLSQDRQPKGSSALLRPPIEHHIFRNPSPDTPVLTLHIYGGELASCNVFLPDQADWFRREVRPLSYDP